MAEWPANGVTDWNTKMRAWVNVEHNEDGTHRGKINTLRARMYLSSDQSINNASLTVVAFNATTFDDNSITTTGASAKITPAVSGYYQINAALRINSLKDGGLMLFRLYKNTGIAFQYSVTAGSASNTSAQVGDVLFLNATDYIQLKVQHDHGSARDLDGESFSTFMTLQKVDG